ncbi:hypothetical protein OEG84_02390 [Hoeflea sp. G2-23]|uniref:Secreted protein n=1 Tax=Hoeflea algicola TaxID=2983763 RepID=A0ABT3Z4A1_9HYPH|nr:hypothetical protein [Hoeflea algicola]MCY0146593.1 hypothetical protein [Hoeflea algicola]
MMKPIVDRGLAPRFLALASLASVLSVASAAGAQDQTEQQQCEQKCMDANDADNLQCRVDEEMQQKQLQDAAALSPDASAVPGSNAQQKTPGVFITEVDAYEESCLGFEGQAALSQCLDRCEAN